MRGARKAEPKEPKIVLVRCRDCQHEVRDTEGISRVNGTGEYFMCHCKKDHDITKWGYKAKLFRDHQRTCRDYRRKRPEQ